MKVNAYGFLDESRKIGGVPIPELIITFIGFIIGFAFFYNVLKSIIVAGVCFVAAKFFFARNQKGYLQKKLLTGTPHVFAKDAALGTKHLEKILTKRVFF